MLMRKIILIELIVTVAVSMPLPVNAAIPLATTSSNQEITATLEGSTLLYGQATILTNSYAIAMSSNPDTLSNPAVHSSTAFANVYIPNDGNTIATFNSIFNTEARAFSSEPLFSRAAAISQSSVVALVAPAASNTLNLNWNFNELNIQAQPTSTFAYISDTIHVMQAFATGIQESMIGFFSYVENGKQTTGFFGDTGVTQILKTWFDSNFLHVGNQATLAANPEKLNIQIALTPSQDPLLLQIDNIHTEISYEAPPAATNQVDNKIGHLAVNGDNNQLHWNANSGLLSFDKLLINTFGDNPLENDPLSGGYLEIDPLQLLTNADGRLYFLGDQLRLVDKAGEVLFRASLPSIVFDDDLFAKQGFNLFAPILNILEANPSRSPWLEDYLAKVNIDSLLLPELFIGFNPQLKGDDIWRQSFDTLATTVLSFSGVPSKAIANVSEPGELMLLITGLASLLAMRSYRS